MSTPVIVARGVGKRYVKYDDSPMLASAMLRFRTRSRRSRLWAVRDVDLEVEQGGCVGIMGRNGSGKSTLLQMISGITAPTEGSVLVRGRIAPLISVGVGFHPELSGRDNVFVNGTILGLTRQQIAARFDEIVDFADLGPFIDTPVKFYSSGMTVRLGFSVAIHCDPEVLIVDEVLAVGDFAFQLKCFDRMAEIRANGTTVLVVSHNIGAIRRMCDSAIVLIDGHKDFHGDTSEAISRFHEVLQEAREIEDDDDRGGSPIEPGHCELVGIHLIDGSGKPTHHVKAGERVVARARVRALQDIAAPFAGISMTSSKGVRIYTDTNMNREPFPAMRPGDEADIDVSFMANLPSGSYTLALVFAQERPTGGAMRFFPNPAIDFYVSGRPLVHGVADLGATFGATDSTKD